MTSSVATVIVTYNDPRALDECIAAIEGQLHPPDTVVVVDNASSPPASPHSSTLDLRIVRSEDNGGPAGGFALGLEEFIATGHAYAWVMDDDCQPESSALATLLDEADPEKVLIPELVEVGGPVHQPAWCGVLIPRAVVKDVGVPRRDFVWWAEDTEYLQWRIPKAGFEVSPSPARVFSGHPRRSGTKPSWKYYYEARNAVYMRVYLKRHNVSRRMFRVCVRIPIGIIVRGESRGAYLRMHFRGIADGTLGRLGKRVPLE